MIDWLRTSYSYILLQVKRSEGFKMGITKYSGGVSGKLLIVGSLRGLQFVSPVANQYTRTNK